MIKKLLNLLLGHKIAIIVLIAVAGGGFYYYKTKSAAIPTSYTLGKVERGSIIKTVSGSGQVSAKNQVELKSKISAEIININVAVGQQVKTGDIIAQMDTISLARKVKEAKNSLDSARASLNLKLAGATKEDILAVENSVKTAKFAYETAQRNLEYAKITAEQDYAKAKLDIDNGQVVVDAYDDAKATINSAYLALRTGIVTADDILCMNKFNDKYCSYKEVLGVKDTSSLSAAQNQFNSTYNKFKEFENLYNITSSSWTQSGEDSLLNKALDTLTNMKSMEHEIYNVMTNSVTGANMSQTTLDGYKSSASSQENALASSINSVQSTIQTIYNAKKTLETSKNNLEQVRLSGEKSIKSAVDDVNNKKISYENAQISYESKIAKPRDVDLASLRIQISQAQDNYNQAVEDLNDAKIISPIDGVIAVADFVKGDSVISEDTIATIITTNQIANITLNEVDAAKVKVNQKVNLTFSAIEDLEMTGVVTKVDSIGTVTQGVVNYNVEIALDAQDERIKPQMSVSAMITTDEKFDVLIILSSAIKSDAKGSYIEIFGSSAKTTLAGNQPSDPNTVTSDSDPQKKYIEVGLSDDTYTEIISGLLEEESIIIKTISSASTATTKSTTRSTGLGGMMVGGPGR